MKRIFYIHLREGAPIIEHENYREVFQYKSSLPSLSKGWVNLKVTVERIGKQRSNHASSRNSKRC